jgi:transcription elongation factor SPT5
VSTQGTLCRNAKARDECSSSRGYSSDGFIEQDEGTHNEDYQRRTAAENQSLDIQRRKEEEMDAEKIAAELRERYRSQRGLTARSDYAEVPQRMLMPSVNDPGLYAVRCRVSDEGGSRMI